LPTSKQTVVFTLKEMTGVQTIATKTSSPILTLNLKHSAKIMLFDLLMQMKNADLENEISDIKPEITLQIDLISLHQESAQRQS